MRTRIMRALGVATITWILAASAAAWCSYQVAPTVTQHQAELRRCAGTSRGQVQIDLTLSADGHLTHASLVGEPTPPMRRFGNCVIRRARTWTFPENRDAFTGRVQLEPMDDHVVVRAASRD
ncbi:MAG: hypothetical protein AB7S26_24755 [Sandaracinaceae bacterium]